MNRHKWLHQIISLGLFLVFLVGCSAPATPSPMPIPPTATLTLIPPTATETPLPPTPTQIPSTPTRTQVPGLIAKAGHWEGEPSVSFDITPNGDISNFSLVGDQMDGSKCNVNLELITVEADNTFAFTSFRPYETLFSSLTDSEKIFIQTAVVMPTPIDTDTGEMYKAMDINGKFRNSTEVSGIFMIILCEDIITYMGYPSGDWKAEWKGP